MSTTEGSSSERHSTKAACARGRRTQGTSRRTRRRACRRVPGELHEGGRMQDEPHAEDLEEEVPGEHHGGEQL